MVRHSGTCNIRKPFLPPGTKRPRKEWNHQSLVRAVARVEKTPDRGCIQRTSQTAVLKQRQSEEGVGHTP